jgi:hypothetical protein
MESKIGPTLQIIPEQRIYSCFGCKYHEYRILRTGLNPVFDTNCLKMNIYGEVLEDKDISSNVGPFILDNNSKTPSQCPYIKTEERNDKISDLGITDVSVSDLFGNCDYCKNKKYIGVYGKPCVTPEPCLAETGKKNWEHNGEFPKN